MQTLEKQESQETQEMRLRRLEDIMETAVSNQTQVLRLQQEHSQRLDKVVERLYDHTLILQEHSTILQEHSRILLDHSKRLENLEDLMTRVVEELVSIREILDSSRGMGFAPEPGDSE
ncbi:MAG: hypothetical protein OXG23_09945 [Chloroflexi bacterium]|nr:hypothetical protein [Chloroflexota bacterium]MDE2637969.1 hypothetical protein [Chloroflexota bacterium]